MSPEPRMPSAIAGLETFSLSDDADEGLVTDYDSGDDAPLDTRDVRDADSFFNLPDDDDDEEDN
jgi:hypothetical protein